jgi:hypothetical protein
MEGDMRKFILITAMVLVSATAHAGGPRSLTMASSDQPAKSVETRPAETKPAETTPAEATPEAPKFVERPSVVDTKTEQPAAQCQPAPTTADAPTTAPKDFATTDKPKRRHQSTESRIISELHRHGIYW